MAPKVLVSDALSESAVQIFRDRGVEVDFEPKLGKDKDALIAKLRDGGYEGLAIRSATKVTQEALDAATDLKVVARAGIGVDNVDIPAASQKGVIVMNTPFGNSITTAEHAIAMMFAVARQIPEADASTQAGKWEKSKFMGVEITGKTLGTTSLLVWQRGENEPRPFRLRGIPVRDALETAPKSPELSEARIAPGVALSGRLPNLQAHRQARQAAQAGDSPLRDDSRITLENQVLTEVKIADVSRATAQSFGLNLAKITANTQLALSPPGVLSGVANGDLQSGAGFLPVNDAFQIVVGDPSRGAAGVLSLLERRGLAQVLAEPSLLATSGQTATYLVGGEFPVPVSQGTGTAGGGISVEYKEFGVRLSLTPTVLARDRIALKIAPEVSDLDFSNAIQVGGVATPALRVRRTDTSIELGDGESFVISGLISSNASDSVDKVPWLGEVPILGAFFKSTTMSRDDKELIMVVTPHLVRPMGRPARRPPLPGERSDVYRPRFDQLIFQERGDFDEAEFGFGN